MLQLLSNQIFCFKKTLLCDNHGKTRISIELQAATTLYQSPHLPARGFK